MYIRAVVLFVLLNLVSVLNPAYAEASDSPPLSKKGQKQFGFNLGYGYSFSSNNDIRFANFYPYFGYVLTDPVGRSLYRGTLQGIVEGAFSSVFKNQRTYSSGLNFILRYNLLPASLKWRPYIQGGTGFLVTNLRMKGFGSNFNFCTGGAAGLQYFFNPSNSVSVEWRAFHISNADINRMNSGLNMNNFFIGYSRLF